MKTQSIKIIDQKINKNTVLLTSEYIIPTEYENKSVKIVFDNDFELFVEFFDVTGSKEKYKNTSTVDDGDKNKIHLKINYSDDDVTFGLVKTFSPLFSRTYKTKESDCDSEDNNITKRERCYFNFLVHRITQKSLLFKLQLTTREVE